MTRRPLNERLQHQETPTMPVPNIFIVGTTCTVHEQALPKGFQNYIICNDCGALFDWDATGGPWSPHLTDGLCPACGACLLPSRGEPFTARVVCRCCAIERIGYRESIGQAAYDSDPEWLEERQRGR